MNVIVILCDTLRRDHCGPYNQGKPLNQCWSAQAPDWIVPTPNMDRLAERGTVFRNAYCGSTPCMPARRDIYTGRYEFLERGWGPLEEEDLDLPRQVSGPPNKSIRWTLEQGHRVSSLITDHFHLWEKGSGNYHMGYTGFDFVRGCEADNWLTDPVSFPCPESDELSGLERHWRNVHLTRKNDADYFCAQVFQKAADWLRRNRTHEDFYLHLDVFDPHEPWDPPEALLKMFDPNGYSETLLANPPYAPWKPHISEDLFNSLRARYAAKVVFLDHWLGHLLDTMDTLDLWKDTLVIFTSDHGTYNGDHDRMGKMQTHQFDAVGHIPFIMSHPEWGHGGRSGSTGPTGGHLSDNIGRGGKAASWNRCPPSHPWNNPFANPGRAQSPHPGLCNLRSIRPEHIDHRCTMDSPPSPCPGEPAPQLVWPLSRKIHPRGAGSL